jgi:hypothetical protein
MFHHLYRIANDGLLKRWLVVFRNLSVFSEEKKLRRQALAETELLFSTPDWEIWWNHLVLGKSKPINTAQLVVIASQTVIWANAVLPFFLALARLENELELEKLLYQLFMILPAEASNSKKRFMEQRLWFSELSKSTKLEMNTFGSRQGLIRIQHDFCHNFHQGCVRCELPRLLED